MIALSTRLRLAPKARLRPDRVTGRLMLLYPEHGLALNETAAEVLRLCTGQLTVEEILERLRAKYSDDPEKLVIDVCAFLETLISRRLLVSELQ